MKPEIREVNAFNWPRQRDCGIDPLNALFSDIGNHQVFLTDSGKGAIDLVLSFYRETGRLRDKNSEVWVPPWMGAWVYNIMQKNCFPSIVASKRTRGVFIYHQYGYPQRIDRILEKARSHCWFVIEDCAHALMSHDRDRRLGTIGDAGIFIFSKFFPSLMGGAIITQDKQLSAYIAAHLKNPNDWASRLCLFTKILSERSTGRQMKSFWNHWVEMSYGIYDMRTRINPVSRRIISRSLSENAIAVRNANRDFFLKKLSRYGIFLPSEEAESITPYVLPIFSSRYRLQRIIDAFAQNGIASGIYHFDAGRDMSKPNYIPCAWIPVHEGIRESDREAIVKSVKKVFNEQ